MKKLFLIIFLFFFNTKVYSSIVKDEIIKNLIEINNISFKFEQNINGKIENGRCILEYPKKISCTYDLKNKKILITNGKTLVIKTSNSYYLYPIEKTPLNFILDKNYLINQIRRIKEREIDDKFINFIFYENDNEINLFFDKKTYNLIGWQTLDIYQNLSITYIYSITKNQKIKNNLFKLPEQN